MYPAARLGRITTARLNESRLGGCPAALRHTQDLPFRSRQGMVVHAEEAAQNRIDLEVILGDRPQPTVLVEQTRTKLLDQVGVIVGTVADRLDHIRRHLEGLSTLLLGNQLLRALGAQPAHCLLYTSDAA